MDSEYGILLVDGKTTEKPTRFKKVMQIAIALTVMGMVFVAAMKYDAGHAAMMSNEASVGAATKDAALKFVQTHFKEAKFNKYRLYASTDFLGYKEMFETIVPLEEFQKSWALFLAYSAKPATPAAAGGTNGAAYEPAEEVYYTAGGDFKTAPTLGTKETAGAIKVMLNGHGQCNYFAGQTYDALKTKCPSCDIGKAPKVEKIAVPGHNWVLVNHEAADKGDWVAVDMWMGAMGVPMANCICLAPETSIKFYEQAITVLETFDPNL